MYKINVLTSFYITREQDRHDEIKYCIEKNSNNQYIDRIYIFSENLTKEHCETSKYSFLKNPKITILETKTRPTYKLYFDFARENIPHGEVCCVINSDIYFYKNICRIHEVTPSNFDCLITLTRHNPQPGDGIYNDDASLYLQGEKGDSHDCWIFLNPIKTFPSDIVLGINGCDSYLAEQAKRNGIKLWNPCNSITIRHVHGSSERNDIFRDKHNKHGNPWTYWDAPDYNFGISIPFTNF